MAKNKTITVKGTAITILLNHDADYISLTDIARYKDAVNTDAIIQNWLRNRNTVELLGFWEMMYNPNFKPLEFEGFKKQAGLNSFVLTPKKWIETTNTIGITSKSGRYGSIFKVVEFDHFKNKNHNPAIMKLPVSEVKNEFLTPKPHNHAQ